MALTELAQFPDPVAAEIARGWLASEGIAAVILDAGMASMGLGPLAPVRLMVDEADRKAAANLLSEHNP